MADSVSDADKIRLKRLAKLGGQGSAPKNEKAEESSASAESSLQAPAAGAKVTGEQPKPGLAETTGTQNPFSQLGKKDFNGSRQQIEPVTINIKTNSLKRDRASTSDEQVESVEQWEHKALGSIFRVSLDPARQQDAEQHKLLYLDGTRQELEAAGDKLQLSASILEQVLLEAASNLPEGITPLDYLIRCWKRVSRQHRIMRKTPGTDKKQAAIAEARRLCMSYCIFAITMPDFFGIEPPATSPLTTHLLLESGDELGIDHDFLSELVARFPEDETVAPAIVTAVEELSDQLAGIDMGGDYKKYMAAMRNLVQFPAIVEAITKSQRFLPAESVTAPTYETVTLLGPFFALSPLQKDVTNQYFAGPATLSKEHIATSQQALRMTLQTHQLDLFEIADRIIRASKGARDNLLDWFAGSLNINHKRRAMQVKPDQVSSDGFMINITVCLDKLCEPFMDANFSKIDRIDVDYWRRAPRIDIKEETKLNADQKTSDAFYSQKVEGASNFISEIFFLNLAAHHYGTGAANANLSGMGKDLKRLEEFVKKLELDRVKYVNNSAILERFDTQLRRYRDILDQGLSNKFAIEGVLLDELMQGRSMQFMRYVIVWLLRLVSPDYPKRPLSLPLPENHTMVFQCLPEYFLDDIVSTFKFIMHRMPLILTSTQSEELVMLCITLLRHSEFVKNPYLKSGLVTILFQGTWEMNSRPRGVLGDLLNAMPFALQHLLHSVMKFYIEVETTGTHTQFFDKFNIRFEIFQIIKCIWPTTSYRDQLSQEAKVNLEFFVRFVNLLLNDVTFVLDEAFTSFIEIRKLTQELMKSDELEEAVRTAKQEALETAKGRAKSYMSLTNETVAMLRLFTEALADSFTKPEIVQRLADMLDYNLEAMVGPKSSNLKVDNLEEYQFRPRQLLSDIIEVYLNLRKKENFILAVARDGRSYKPATFQQATDRLTHHSLMSAQKIKQWKTLTEKVRLAKEEDDQAEEDLGEIPEEFLDPLMYTLMVDPVILPTSRTTIDRSTIQSHLLSDPNDPFNRVPLRIEDVVPDTDLIERIRLFKEEKKALKLQERADAANAATVVAGEASVEVTASEGVTAPSEGDGKMDTSAG